MIFYFSATGNSLYIAKKLSKFLDDNLISIADAIKSDNFNYVLKHRICFSNIFLWCTKNYL